MSDATPHHPDRRYQVFISSTFADLKDERKAALEGVYEAGHIPIALERFSAANESDLQTIKRAMEDCQVYILILGHRYGQIVPGETFSFTELEYDLAQELELLTLTFVLDEKLSEERRTTLNPKVARDVEDLRNYGKLADFHSKIEKFKQFWETAPELKYQVELALVRAVAKYDRRGFIREPEDPSILTSADEFVVDVVTELKSFRTLYQRCSQEKERKRGVARYFVQQYMNRLRRHQVSLFLESGSTIAFVAKELSTHLNRVVKTIDGRPTIQISSNNLLAYLLLWLNARVPCTLFPWSPPVDVTYGASYGGLEDNLVNQKPDYRQPMLDIDAWNEIQKLLSTPFTLSSLKEPTLLLAATSGLQIGKDHNLKFEPNLGDAQKAEMKQQIAKCFGPHVGSYHNKVFKRFMYVTAIPIVIFITSDKIDCQIDMGKCHFVLDSEFGWEQFYRDHPVAFAVRCDTDSIELYSNRFVDLGFDILRENSTSPVGSFIARNKAFITPELCTDSA